MPLDKNSDVSFLIDGLLQQLAIGIYEFQLIFNNGSRISISDKILLNKDKVDEVEIRADQPEQSKEVYFLLGQTIKDANLSSSGILEIVFDNQSKITLAPSENGYESYVIWWKEICIAV
jgi:hypothetical protein